MNAVSGQCLLMTRKSSTFRIRNQLILIKKNILTRTTHNNFDPKESFIRSYKGNHNNVRRKILYPFNNYSIN